MVADVAELSVTVQVNCSPGSIWFGSAFGTELVSGMQFKAIVGETTTEVVVVEIAEAIALPKKLETVNPESVTETLPAGAAARTVAATLAILDPVGIVV